MTQAELVYVDPSQTAIRLVAAALSGAILGWEREIRNKPAGLRTNMLVSVGAAAVTMVAINLYFDITREQSSNLNADPIRIVSGVIGGLGFLGAGAIIQSRGDVEGMTTAATIWLIGGVGVACGLAYYAIALTTTLVALLILYIVGRFEHSRLAPDGVRKQHDDHSGEVDQ